jgi:hypothetical protein
MSNPTLVKKASGITEPFSQQKLESSLKRAGADEEIVENILRDLKPWLYNGVTTRKIYKMAFGLLTRQKPGMAARYSLKRAIMELGPTGFPFEHFIGQLFSQWGFKAEVGQIIQGRFVKHEVDVVATGIKKQIFVECKYYNVQGKFADVKVSLYIHSRFEDIIAIRKDIPEYRDFLLQGWIVTNTRFTTDAMDYGRGAGLHLVSWDYPNGQSLKDLIEKDSLFPITVLSRLNQTQKQKLLGKGIVLCRQIAIDPELLKGLDLDSKKREEVLMEVGDLVYKRPIQMSRQ